jgi:hypothetical protein
MRVMPLVVLSAIAVLWPAGQPAAGEVVNSAPARITVGSRVRITPVDTRSESIRGTLAAISGDTLAIAQDEDPTRLRRLPLASIAVLERSLGRHGNSGRCALWGFGIGAAAGLVMGASSSGEDIFFSKGQVTLLSGVLVGGTGALIGALAGIGIRSDRWERVPLDHALGSVHLRPPGPWGPAMACVTVRF